MKNKTCIGIDIGGTNTVFGLIDGNGNILERRTIKTQEYRTMAQYLSATEENIARFTAACGTDGVQGIGIGAPSGNFYKGCIEAQAANLPVKECIPLKQILEHDLHLPVTVDNDANAAAYGELMFGGAVGMRDIIMITLGTGVGSGIVVDGKIVHGHSGLAGELGHSTVFPDGRTCHCGRKGCLEAYASADGICNNYKELLEHQGNPLTPAQTKTLTCKLIGELATSGDPTAAAAYDRAAYALGIALANAVNFSSPQAIFLTGGPTRVGDILLKPLRKHFSEHLLFLYQGTVTLQRSALPDSDAALLGAAALCLEQSLKQSDVLDCLAH